MAIVNAYVVYNLTNSNFVGNDYVQVSINCEKLSAYSPRPGWLIRQIAPGDGTKILYTLTFAPTSDELLDANTIAGLVVDVEGQMVLLDVMNQNVSTFTDACNECCGDVPTIILSEYNGNVPTFVPNSLVYLCIYRLDDGSAQSVDRFAADYVGHYVGKIQVRSSFSNTTHYTIQSYHSYTFFQNLLKSGDTVYSGACGS